MENESVRAFFVSLLTVCGKNICACPAEWLNAAGPGKQDGAIFTATSDVMWGGDETRSHTLRRLAWLFTVVEYRSAECVGWHVAITILGKQPRTGARLFAKLFFLTDGTCAGNE